MYLIDGYNLIFSLTHMQSGLRSMRQKLIQSLQQLFALKKRSGMIVFDGSHQRGEESGLSYPSPLTVAYTPKGQSADEYIVEQIHVSKTPKQITVVTNDRGLTRHARSAGAHTLTNEQLIEWLHKKKKRSAFCEPKETPENMERLLKIFEDKLRETP